LGKKAFSHTFQSSVGYINEESYKAAGQEKKVLRAAPPWLYPITLARVWYSWLVFCFQHRSRVRPFNLPLWQKGSLPSFLWQPTYSGYVDYRSWTAIIEMDGPFHGCDKTCWVPSSQLAFCFLQEKTSQVLGQEWNYVVFDAQYDEPLHVIDNYPCPCSVLADCAVRTLNQTVDESQVNLTSLSYNTWLPVRLLGEFAVLETRLPVL
jgi:hypothetical protein